MQQNNVLIRPHAVLTYLNQDTLFQQPISLKTLHLIRLDLPQKEQFVSGIGIRKSREALIIAWEDKNGNIGYGECSCRPDPYYSGEFIDGAIELVKRFIIPKLPEQGCMGDLYQVLSRIRDRNFTKAAVEMAALQVVEQTTGYSPIDSFKGSRIDEVPVGISLGVYQDKASITQAVESALETGYSRLKFKISPSVDTGLFEHIYPMLQGSDSYISFDANGSFGEGDFDKLGYFVDRYQTMIEQPFAPSRFDLLLEARERFPSMYVCYDEEIKSMGDVIKLHRTGVLDEVNLKVGRVGGILKSLEILHYCQLHHIPCWIGGMFETGIGRTLNLKVASLLPDAKAHDLSPSDRYFLEDIISPAVQMNRGSVNIASIAQCRPQAELMSNYTLAHHSFHPEIL